MIPSNLPNKKEAPAPNKIPSYLPNEDETDLPAFDPINFLIEDNNIPAFDNAAYDIEDACLYPGYLTDTHYPNADYPDLDAGSSIANEPPESYHHSGSNRLTKRAPFHDYRMPGIYLITLVTLNREKLFGKLIIKDKPYIYQSELGRRIFSEELPKISTVFPNVAIWKTCIMPDHIHLIMEVRSKMPDKKHIGNVIAGFKIGCNRLWRIISNNPDAIIFESNYNDRIINRHGQLSTWKRYLADNPRRLALKRMYPELFKKRYNKEILGRKCQIFGNMFLLNIPEKEFVMVHRKDSEETYQENFKRWMNCGEHGGILVGAFISPREKAVRNEAILSNYSVIELCDTGFGKYYKPSGIVFDACAEGRLLQICPFDNQYAYSKISRKICLQLNAFAKEFADVATLII